MGVGVNLRADHIRILPNIFGNIMDEIGKSVTALLAAPVAIATLGSYPKLNNRVKESEGLIFIFQLSLSQL